MASLRLDGLAMAYGAIAALDGITLEIRSGEFFSILGPSGCGKTTLLRLIAGFESPTSGKVFLDGRDITGFSAQDRGIGMVFQNYALFPHMSVFDNVAFGLRTRSMKTAEIRKRVESILEAVGLRSRSLTPVPHLSGGEQQRVAVARALVIEPALLLFDEPLSNLDAALRLRTREEIRRLQRSTRITTVYVTHDQAEAMSLSDRIGVMRTGRLEQVGTPEAMYAAPASLFVAQFLGGGSILEGAVEEGGRVFRTGTLELPLPGGLGGKPGPAFLVIKPEAVRLHPGGDKGVCRGTVEDREYLGFTTNAVVAVGGLRLHAAAVSSDATREWTPGRTVAIELDWSRCALFAKA